MGKMHWFNISGILLLLGTFALFAIASLVPLPNLTQDVDFPDVSKRSRDPKSDLLINYRSLRRRILPGIHVIQVTSVQFLT
jgi:hypothetical protein